MAHDSRGDRARDDEERYRPRHWWRIKTVMLWLMLGLTVAGLAMKVALVVFLAVPTAILLVTQWELNALPFKLWDWFKWKTSGARHEGLHDGWYGYRGRNIRGFVDAARRLWFPLPDLNLPVDGVRGLLATYTADEVQIAAGIPHLSIAGLQRYLNCHRTDENRAMARWLVREVIPAHERRMQQRGG
jgi:hypothetical protein